MFLRRGPLIYWRGDVYTGGGQVLLAQFDRLEVGTPQALLINYAKGVGLQNLFGGTHATREHQSGLSVKRFE